MHSEFEMSMLGEFNFFLGLQIKQSKDGISIKQSKYVKDFLKKFELEHVNPIRTPIILANKLDITHYSDADC